MPKLSPNTFAKHKQKWQDCTACTLYTHRNKVVLARGTVPAPLLFIGESPGASEDVLGRPFVGPAGKLLDEIIRRAEVNVPYAMTNIIACIPLDDNGSKTHQPPRDSIEACHARLLEFIRLCDPKAIVAVGSIADQRLKEIGLSNDSIGYVDIIHPAAILRMNVMQQGLAVQRCIARLSEIVEELQ